MRFSTHSHSKYCCHFQVADEKAGGVHLILYFDKQGSLATRRKWITNELLKLDKQYPDAAFAKVKAGKRVLQVEVYPDPSHGPPSSALSRQDDAAGSGFAAGEPWETAGPGRRRIYGMAKKCRPAIHGKRGRVQVCGRKIGFVVCWRRGKPGKPS